MPVNHLASGDLHYLHKKHDFYNLDISFFYDAQKRSDIHILEHLLLNPYRVLHISGLTLHESTYTFTELNGFTSGVFLSLRMECHKNDAFYLTQCIIELLETPLEITKEIVEREQKVIEAEHEYNGSLSLFGLNYFDKFYTRPDLPGYKLSVTERVQQAYEDIIINNRPIVLIRGDLSDQGVYKSLEKMTHYLSQKEKQRRHSFDYDSHVYKGEVELFHVDQSLHNVVAYNRFFLKSGNDFVLQTLLIFFLKDAFFYYTRFEEGVSYDIFHMYRTVYYGWELYFQFVTKLSSKKLMEMMRSMFDHDKDSFFDFQHKAYRMIKMWKTVEFEEFYMVTQMFLYSGQSLTLDDLADKIINISYENFVNYYYNHWLKGLSLFQIDEKLPGGS